MAQVALVLVLTFFISPGLQVVASRDTDATTKEASWTSAYLDDVTVEPATTSQSYQKPPLHIDVKLIHGRQTHEGLVLMRSSEGGVWDAWGTVCDDGWDDADATVVCRQLGYKAGLARYWPIYGGVNGSVPIYLDDMACLGTEPTLLDCAHRHPWNHSNCNHREDAGVECFVNDDQVSEHVFGNPAVYRQYRDEWKEGVYIPHPHQHLPWGEGTITGWAFYTNSTQPSDVILQIWRQIADDRYQLQGQTEFRSLLPGRHEVKLKRAEMIRFGAGDVLGIAFPNKNPIPFDSHAWCNKREAAKYIVSNNMLKFEKGAVSHFKSKPEAWSSCRIYSVYTKYTAVEYNESSTFSWAGNKYHVVMRDHMTQRQAQLQCIKLYGFQSRLLVLESEYELTFLTGALNSFQIAPEAFWLRGRVNQLSSQYVKWAHCEPARGKECIKLQSEQTGENDYSSKQFSMYAVNCNLRMSFICKTQSIQTSTVISTDAPTHAQLNQVQPGLTKGAVVSLAVMIPAAIIILLLTAVFVHRFRSQRYKRRGESTVGFVHLADDKVNI